MSSAKTIRDLNQIYLNEVSADTALSASKAADKKRGQLAAAGDKEGAAAKAQQASRLYKASAEKRKSEPAKQPDRSYPKGKGANYREDKDWGYDKKGNSLNPVDIEKRKKKDDDLAGSPNYETKKKAEVLSAMKKQGRKLSDKEKSKIADKVVKDKGDTSKSDDRYAYEELTHLRALVEKEVKVKDTRRVVDAIRAYDKSKDASRDATYDTDEGDKEKAEIEKKYAAKERGEIDKDDPNWKKRKYHTGIHGEEVEILKGLLESGKLSEEEVKSILWEGYQRNPEEGERKERESAKKREAIPGQARRGMPPRGDKKREEFERWYAANVR